MEDTLRKKRKKEREKDTLIFLAIYLAVVILGGIIKGICIECPTSYDVINEETIIVKNNKNWNHITITGEFLQDSQLVKKVNYKAEFKGASEIEIPIEEIIRHENCVPEEVDYFKIDEITIHNYKVGAIWWPTIFEFVIAAWPFLIPFLLFTLFSIDLLISKILPPKKER